MMGFAENIQYFRKKNEITQEQLAERMEVSRQTISKWESGTCFPEMDKVLQLCDMFHCSMDVMMKQNAEIACVEDGTGYDRHKNRFIKGITIGVLIVLIGITVMMFLQSAGIQEDLDILVFMLFAIIATIIFVICGLENSRFEEKHPYVEDFYTEEEKDEFYRIFIRLICIGIGIILVGTLFIIASDSFVAVPFGWNMDFYTAVFLIFVTIGAPMLVYAGMMKSKYNLEEYNRDKNPGNAQRERNDRIGRLCGIIMILATIVFLLLGFIGNLWEYSWVSYVVGGLLCGVVSVALSKDEN